MDSSIHHLHTLILSFKRRTLPPAALSLVIIVYQRRTCVIHERHDDEAFATTLISNPRSRETRYVCCVNSLLTRATKSILKNKRERKIGDGYLTEDIV